MPVELDDVPRGGFTGLTSWRTGNARRIDWRKGVTTSKLCWLILYGPETSTTSVNQPCAFTAMAVPPLKRKSLFVSSVKTSEFGTVCPTIVT